MNVEEILDLGRGEIFLGGLEIFNFEALATQLEELEATQESGEVIEIDTTPNRRS